MILAVILIVAPVLAFVVVPILAFVVVPFLVFVVALKSGPCVPMLVS